MCQNHNTQNASQIHGSILLTTNKIPVFMPSLCIKENGNSIVTSWISFNGFQRFCRYADQAGVFANGNQVNCDFATLKALFVEFETLEQNHSLTAILFKNKIYPSAPEVKALNRYSGRKKRFNIWLNDTRRWLRSAIGAGFFFNQRARTNTTK